MVFLWGNTKTVGNVSLGSWLLLVQMVEPVEPVPLRCSPKLHGDLLVGPGWLKPQKSMTAATVGGSVGRLVRDAGGLCFLRRVGGTKGRWGDLLRGSFF